MQFYQTIPSCKVNSISLCLQVRSCLKLTSRTFPELDPQLILSWRHQLSWMARVQQTKKEMEGLIKRKNAKGVQEQMRGDKWIGPYGVRTHHSQDLTFDKMSMM